MYKNFNESKNCDYKIVFTTVIIKIKIIILHFSKHYFILKSKIMLNDDNNKNNH